MSPPSLAAGPGEPPALREPQAAAVEPHAYAHLRIVPARHWKRSAGTVLAVAIIAALLLSLLGNERWEWGVFAQWIFAEPVIDGLEQTLILTALGSLFGFILAVPIALARLSRSTTQTRFPALAAT